MPALSLRPPVDPSQSRLHHAIWQKSTHVQSCLLDNPSLAHARGPTGETALMHAAASFRFEALLALLNLSDPLAMSDSGWSALMFAACVGDLKAVRALLPRSTPLATNEEGDTALALAARGRHVDCVRALIPCGGTELINCHAESPLLLSARSLLPGPTDSPLPLTRRPSKFHAALDATAIEAMRHTRTLFFSAAPPLHDASGGLPDWLRDAANCLELLRPTSNLHLRTVDGERALDISLRAQHWPSVDLLASTMGVGVARETLSVAPVSPEFLPLCQTLLHTPEGVASANTISSDRIVSSGESNASSRRGLRAALRS